jgi:protein SCO1/2
MDRDGRYLGFFPPGTSAERLANVMLQKLTAHHQRDFR